MNSSQAGRWAAILLLLGVPAAAVGACGGSSGNSLFDAGGGAQDGSTASDGSSSGSSSGGGGDGSLFGGDTGTGEGGSHGGCTPKTCKQEGFDCGMNSDGCGGVIDCGTCASPAYCGGGGYSKCGGVGFTPDGAPACAPTTCKALGYDCGPAGDGCGGVLQCGSCGTGQICGGAAPGVCGSGTTCTNLCKQQVACDGGTPTTITGRVVAGTLPTYGTPDPVPNVLVYVPNAPLTPFTPGVSCGCPPATGNPLVWTTTAVNGTFTLPNVPVGKGIPVVIQLGRWRREVTFDITGACQSVAVGDIRMPRNHTDGLGGQADIPLTALSTGGADSLECVLLKMGVDAAEFTTPTGGGRIHMYMGNGADVTGTAPAESTLTATSAALAAYDQVMFPCWGTPVDKPATDLANVVAYASAGGRVFSTHYSYTWLYMNAPFSSTATWNPDTQYGSDVGAIQTSFPRGKTFGDWMTLVGAATGTPPSFPITSPRHDFDAPVPPSLTYVDATQNGTFPLHYTFDTPWQSANTCGRVVYSDFHVADVSGTGQTFPAECDSAAMNAQEKALEYMIWDLGQCLGPNQPSCAKRTCMQQNIGCGPAGDGCAACSTAACARRPRRAAAAASRASAATPTAASASRTPARSSASCAGRRGTAAVGCSSAAPATLRRPAGAVARRACAAATGRSSDSRAKVAISARRRPRPPRARPRRRRAGRRGSSRPGR